jgi:DNA polymerase phi
VDDDAHNPEFFAPKMSALVEVKKDNSQLLQFFWDLSKVEPSERGAAAEKLILAVQEQQSTFQSTDGSKISPNLSYSLDRLINGLASSNGSSRQGFAMALVEVIFFPRSVRLK